MVEWIKSVYMQKRNKARKKLGVEMVRNRGRRCKR